MTTRERIDAAACAHLIVRHVRIQHADGLFSSSWECRDCRMLFVPEAERDASREALRVAREAILQWSRCPCPSCGDCIETLCELLPDALAAGKEGSDGK